MFFSGERSMGSKPKSYPNIVKTLSEIYHSQYFIKKTNILGHRKGQSTAILPHRVYTIKTNDAIREKAGLDLRVLDYVDNKKIIDLEKDSKKLNIPGLELKNSISRLEKISKLIDGSFVKEVKVK